MLNKILSDSDRNKIIAILLILWVVIMAFGLSSQLATYKNEPIKDTVDMFISLFVITIIVERTIAVFFQFAPKPGELTLQQKLLDDTKSYDYLESIKENVDDPKKQETKKKLKSSIKVTKSNILIYKQDSVILMTLISLIICTAITSSGVRILEHFVKLPDNVPIQHSFFEFLDTILTATVLTGGSKGLHEVAAAILKFMRGITKH